MTQNAEKYETILYEMAAPGIARVTLSRPEALNSFTGQMLAELTDAWKRLAQDKEVRCVLVSGAGRAFCAGQDLRANPEAIQDLQTWLANTYRPMLSALEAIRKPTIAVVNGVAAGAGFSLTLACDFRVASSKARFIPAFGKIALVPDSGMSYFLPRLVGFSRALEVVGANRDLTAEEALAWGMVNRVSAPEQLEETALAFATQLAQAAPVAYALTRQMFHRSNNMDLMTALMMEEEYQGQAGSTDDFKEGLAAFEQKRAPEFKGK
ncbi:MAG TPA: enoyl-CoA hydratase-related protein [Chloroflexia bacterium]|nr:enoyl-CoA hydratase-related protein [Chloroflexia bacterium]